MNILCLLVSKNDSCAFYRSSGIVPDLRRKLSDEHNIDIIQFGEVPLDWSLFIQYDLVFMQRHFSKESLNLCNYLKQCGIKIWLDWDDNLFALNPENPTYSLYNNPDVQANIKGMLSLADAVTVPTEYLKQAFSEFSKKITVIPNAFNDTLFKRPELLPRTNHCVWRGPEAHIYDLCSYLNDINRLTEEFTDWIFMFMGFNPGESILHYYLSQTNNKGHIPSLDIVVYMKKLFDLAPACMHVPLADNVFNRCKSNIAAIEGSYAGAVCVAPAWWNMPGTIPYMDNASYYEAIRSVLSGEVDKVALNKEAWEYIYDCLRLSKVNELRIEIINSLL